MAASVMAGLVSKSTSAVSTMTGTTTMVMMTMAATSTTADVVDSTATAAVAAVTRACATVAYYLPYSYHFNTPVAPKDCYSYIDTIHETQEEFVCSMELYVEDDTCYFCTC